MKFQTTAKAVKANYWMILRVGYCKLQCLLRDERPVAFSAGTYGWNFDLYDIDGVAICTGYRGMPGVGVPYEIVKRYEEACDVRGYVDCRKLAREFIKEALAAIEAEKHAKASKRSKKAKV